MKAQDNKCAFTRVCVREREKVKEAEETEKGDEINRLGDKEECKDATGIRN